MMDCKALGKACRAIRHKQGLSQREAAEALSVSAVHLCNIEHGTSWPSLNFLVNFTDIFGIDPYLLAWVLFGDMSKLPASVQKAASRLSVKWEHNYVGFLEDWQCLNPN